MSTKNVRTGADVVRYGSSVRIDCRACGTSRTLGGVQFAEECGTGSIGISAKRLKCSRCGAKRAQVLVLPPP